MRPPLKVAVAGVLVAPLVLMAPPLAGASSTHAPVRAPNVIGLSRSQTYAAMRAANLFFTTSGPGSADGTWTRVVAERPSPGAVLAWHSSVALTVTRATSASASRTSLASTTKAIGKTAGRVPNLSHLTRAQVYVVMRRADLYFSTTGPGSSSGTWKSVVAESPKPGTPIAPRSSVSLSTSLLAPVPPGHVRVPNLTRLSRAQVYVVMRHADLYFTTRGAGGPWTRVLAQSPAPGSVVALRSTITLTTASAVTAALKQTRPAPVVTHATAAPLVGSTHYRVGVATWYSWIPGQCATSYLPMGTRINVEDLDTGVSISCVVTDRQDYSPGRVVDLNETQFSQLTALWRGVVRVKVSW